MRKRQNPQKETKMKTNEQARQALTLIHEVSGQLLEASKDGKIDVAEMVNVAISNLPSVMVLAGVNPGGSYKPLGN